MSGGFSGSRCIADQPQTRNAEKHFPTTPSQTRCKPGVCGKCWIKTKMPEQQLLSKVLLGLTTFLHKKNPLESPQLSEVCNRGSRSESEPIHEPERTDKRPATRLAQGTSLRERSHSTCSSRRRATGAWLLLSPASVQTGTTFPCVC